MRMRNRFPRFFLTLVVVPWIPKVTRRGVRKRKLAIGSEGFPRSSIRECFLRRSHLTLVTGTSYLPLSRYFHIIYIV